MKNIDATLYRFIEYNESNAFGMMLLPKGVEEVKVINTENTHYSKNGVSLNFYGAGSVDESAGMLLEDNRILFCVISGSAFTDTFHSAEDIRMKYYLMEEL